MLHRVLPLLALLATLPACSGSGRATAPLAETREDLVRSLTARGWVVEPVSILSPTGLSTMGTRYAVRQQRRDAREVQVYEYPEPDSDVVDRDVHQLLSRTAGSGTTLYRRPSLVVLTFGRTRTPLDAELTRLLGPPQEVVVEEDDG